MDIYEVGGCVRDEVLGIPSKDIDFSVVIDEGDIQIGKTGFETMVFNLEKMGFKIFKSDEAFLTVRAQFPKGDQRVESLSKITIGRDNLTADFVLARKEGSYSDGRRPDDVEMGTLLDDLARRDFTMNAIAKDANGTFIDPFNGFADIRSRVIQSVGNPNERFAEDALRAVRALRFSVTKGFSIHPDVKFAMQTKATIESIVHKISDERISDELDKMFKHSTLDSLYALQMYPHLRDAMFAGRVNLMPTMKTKGRK